MEVRHLGVVLIIVCLSGCSSVGPLPSFRPLEYTREQVLALPGNKLAFACRDCVVPGMECRMCVAVHPLEKPLYWDGYTAEGRPGAYVPIQFEYRNDGEKRGLLPVLDVRLEVGGETFEPNRAHSDVGYNDFVLPGASRTISVGFVLAERTIRGATELAVTCPCPGNPEEHLTFGFAAIGPEAEQRAAAPN
jgi:hypothetical protein